MADKITPGEVASEVGVDAAEAAAIVASSLGNPVIMGLLLFGQFEPEIQKGIVGLIHKIFRHKAPSSAVVVATKAVQDYVGDSVDPNSIHTGWSF